jgi:hypothetical protein
MQEETIIGILRNVGELYVATLIKEDDECIWVKNPAFLAVNGQNGQININFIPLEMLSVSPALNIRNFLTDPTQEIQYPFYKKSVLLYNLALTQNVVDNYKNLTVAPKSPAVETLPEKPSLPKNEVLKMW